MSLDKRKNCRLMGYILHVSRERLRDARLVELRPRAPTAYM